ncbi:PIG-L deacetylase family protein [Acetobacter sp.]|uniref:PIG-L deacetylase family protein n=1 Tax=Acetobacter sp. TaxID=440 RepID=UPI00258F61F0|nr:PIG-L family deacetylase [Acetobacter sp.]MCC6105094.1 PIG-L family deacetylase [Acetobacter sp.]
MKNGELISELFRLPVRDIEEIAPGTALILAPHPDDESLGCGGFIAEAVARGRPPVVVIVSDGSGSHPASREWPEERLRQQREKEAREAARILGLPPERLYFLGLRDTAVPTEGPEFRSTVDRLAELALHYDCNTLLVPWRHDPHCDHEAVWLMGKVLKAMLPHLRLLAYPVWGLTLPSDGVLDQPFPAGWRLDIGAHLATKRHAVEAHESQRGLVIQDDPDGFVMPENLLEKIIQTYEIYLLS